MLRRPLFDRTAICQCAFCSGMLQAPQPSAIPRHVVVVNLDSGEVAAGRDAALSGQLPDGTAFADGLGGWLFKLRESLVAEQITTISLEAFESSANTGSGGTGVGAFATATAAGAA